MPPKKATHINDLPSDVLGRIIRDAAVTERRFGWVNADGASNSQVLSRNADGIKDARLVNKGWKRAADDMINGEPADSPIAQLMVGARAGRDLRRLSIRAGDAVGKRSRSGLRAATDIRRPGGAGLKVVRASSIGKLLVEHSDDKGLLPFEIEGTDLRPEIGERRPTHTSAVYIDQKPPPGSSLLARQRRGRRKAVAKGRKAAARSRRHRTTGARKAPSGRKRSRVRR